MWITTKWGRAAQLHDDGVTATVLGGQIYFLMSHQPYHDHLNLLISPSYYATQPLLCSTLGSAEADFYNANAMRCVC